MGPERLGLAYADDDFATPPPTGKKPEQHDSPHQAARVGRKRSERSFDCARKPTCRRVGDGRNVDRGVPRPVRGLLHVTGSQALRRRDIRDEDLDGKPPSGGPSKRLAGRNCSGSDAAVLAHRLYPEPQVDERLELRRDAVEWRQIEGEVIAIDLERAVYLGVNGSGAVLWELLAHGTTRALLVDRLVEAFALDEHRAEEDVDRFLAELERRGLLVRA
jgi:Coenzyme PQQ synthesis protein D (PqqD)